MINILHESGRQYISDITPANFDSKAIEVFNYQYNNCIVYQDFVNHLKVNPNDVKSVLDIPFLPISFFKTHKIVSKTISDISLVFESSKTTGDTSSKHFVADETIYLEALKSGFEKFYGSPEQYTYLALLPSYLERSNASLVHMVQQLMNCSNKPNNGFYLNNFEELASALHYLDTQNEPVILIGVTFALLDFAEKHSPALKNVIVMETGGMKGRREELTRSEVHCTLKDRFGVNRIHSEYGMTELLSQAYATIDGIFQPADTMSVLLRDMNDPLDIKQEGSGLLNIIDLANLYSCSFIATDDVGRLYADGSFEVLGRADNSALRGCNLMVL